jgi:hypothetical protein
VDSDNESDFDVMYENFQDNFEDLHSLIKPVFISDVIQGLQSEDISRFNLAI